MSFCPKCGKEVEEGSGFCGNCGAKIGQQTARESELLKSGEKSFDLKLSEMSKKQKIRGIAIIVVIIAAIIGVSLFVNRKEKLNLDDYISVNYTGYDTVGTATATFDFEKFDRDVKLKMRYKNSTEQTALFNDIYEDINKSIAFDLSKESELKNGDKIELKWNCQKEIALNEYNIILNCKDKTLDVNQLKPTKKVDLFKDVTIQYEGIAPNIRVTIQNNSTDSVLSSLYLTADKTSGIKKGDKITVSTGVDAQEMLQEYGYIFTEMSKTYTCDKVDSYITKMTDITADYLKTLQKQATDTITAYIAEHNDKLSASAWNYEGMYFLTYKGDDEVIWGDNNLTCLVYSATISSTDGSFQPFVIHIPVSFDNIIQKADGSLSCTLTNSKNQGNYSIPGTWLYVNGYGDTKEMHDELITRNAASYTYEISDGLKQYGN